jgi:hypothetical protein
MDNLLLGVHFPVKARYGQLQEVPTKGGLSNDPQTVGLNCRLAIVCASLQVRVIDPKPTVMIAIEHECEKLYVPRESKLN